jgi:transposase-like protein/IS1 family transposase
VLATGRLWNIKTTSSVNCHCCSGPTKKFGRFENKNRLVQRFRCTRCGKTFSEDQPLQGVALPHDKVIQIVKLFAEGVSIRAAPRLTGCHTHSVMNVLNTVGKAVHEFHDKTSRNLEVGPLQIDELWSRVGIMQRRTTPDDAERGDQYTFLALTAREKFIVSYHTGKRDYENTDIFVADLAHRINGRVQITTDGWPAYPDTIRRYMLGRLDLAVCQKKLCGPANGSGSIATIFASSFCGSHNQSQGWRTPTGANFHQLRGARQSQRPAFQQAICAPGNGMVTKAGKPQIGNQPVRRHIQFLQGPLHAWLHASRRHEPGRSRLENRRID